VALAAVALQWNNQASTNGILGGVPDEERIMASKRLTRRQAAGLLI